MLGDAKPSEEYERLRILFRRSSSMPPLPATATRLIGAIDGGEASAIELERIISADPSVTATLLSLTKNGDEPVSSSTIRQAIMRLGQRAIRALAVSLTIKALVRELGSREGGSAENFARHSLAVGFVSRYLSARKHRSGERVSTTWSADEIFAAGLLHDLTYCLLTVVAPEVVTRVEFFGHRHRITFVNAFAGALGGSLGELGAEAVSTWRLPELFSISQKHLAQPWVCPQEYDALVSIGYADFLATTQLGFPLESWPLEYALMPEIKGEFELSLQETEMLRNAVIKLIETVDSAVAA